MMYIGSVSMSNICFCNRDNSACSLESACKRPSYVSSKMPLTSTAAIAAYEKTVSGIFNMRSLIAG